MDAQNSNVFTRQVADYSQAAGQKILDTAKNLHTVAGQLKSDGMTQRAGELAESTAATIERIGAYLHESDPHRLLHDAERFTRQRPWTVAVSSFAVGLGGARLLKASAQRRAQAGAASYQYED